MEGFISVHRKIFNNWVWDDKPFSKGQAWIDILLMANHKDNKFPLGKEIVTVERGSFITSELKLMERWGWGKTKTRTFLKLLEDDKMIIKKSTNKQTTITVYNYNVYQISQNYKQTVEEPQTNYKQTTDKPQTYTNNNDNKSNNDNNEDNICASDNARGSHKQLNEQLEKQIEELWKAYPNKKGKATAIKKIPKLIKKYGYDQMARCVSRYAEECRKKGTEQEYIKHGSTFFNGGYMDYLDQDKSSCSNDTEKNRQFDEEQREASKELEGMTAKERELYTYTLTIDLDGITPRYKDGQEIPKVYKYGIWMYVAKDGDINPRYNENEQEPDPF